jgi:hypothetical protein
MKDAPLHSLLMRVSPASMAGVANWLKTCMRSSISAISPVAKRATAAQFSHRGSTIFVPLMLANPRFSNASLEQGCEVSRRLRFSRPYSSALPQQRVGPRWRCRRFYSNMNVSTLRGAAVVALFSLAVSRGEALTITEPLNDSRTTSFSGSLGQGGGGANLGTRWFLPNLSSDLYSFNAAIQFTAHATAFNLNPFDFAIQNNTFLFWTPSISLLLPSGRTVTVPGQAQGQSISALQGPGEGLSLSLQFTETLNLSTMITQEDFVGAAPMSLFATAALIAGTQFGGGTHEATFDGSFSIERVPDGGASLALAASSMFALILVAHCARNRSLPGCRSSEQRSTSPD